MLKWLVIIALICLLQAPTFLEADRKGGTRTHFSSKRCIHKGKNYPTKSQIKDDCNTCFCSGGMWACTTMACPPKVIGCTTHRGKKYKVGETIKKKCNLCFCSPRGMWACTKMACKPKGCIHNGTLYREGEKRFDMCNMCFCGSTGHWGCTLKFCVPKKRQVKVLPPPEGTKCQKHAKTALNQQRQPMVGVFIPRCAEDGSYARKQCHGSTGYCWCADKEGNKIDGTSTRGKLNCQSKGTTCQRHLKSALNQQRLPMLGVFIPKCAEDGTYARKQCHASTGYCWCADKKGKEIEGTSTRGGLSCETKGCTYDEKSYKEGETRKISCNLCLCASSGEWSCSKMLCPKKEVIPTKKERCREACPRHYNPKCGSDGRTYGNECTMKFAVCNSTGKITEKYAGECRTKCEDQKLLAEKNERQPMVGVFTPKCNVDGTYANKQCHGSTGYCWCADKDGNRIAGTTTRGEVNCDKKAPTKVCKELGPKCRKLCLAGYILDGNKCKTCQCRPRAPSPKDTGSPGSKPNAHLQGKADSPAKTCEELECGRTRVVCPSGHILDGNGCKTCQCRPRAPLPQNGRPGSPRPEPNPHIQG